MTLTFALQRVNVVDGQAFLTIKEKRVDGAREGELKRGSEDDKKKESVHTRFQL